MSKISIIIPTINEADNLPLLLSDLSVTKKEVEIVIVDGGSEDRTIDIALIYGAKVYKSKEKNRGLQLGLSLIHISEPTRLGMISYAVFCLKK